MFTIVTYITSYKVLGILFCFCFLVDAFYKTVTYGNILYSIPVWCNIQFHSVVVNENDCPKFEGSKMFDTFVPFVS
jgi:hypothetical protein